MYELLKKQTPSIFEGENDAIANAANFSSLIFNNIPDLNWAGFYFFKNPDLIVGPFQGQPACVRIQAGKGVCGTSFSERKTIVVEDVHQFEGHIACDPNSNSEIVIPLIKDDKIYGVFDVDSPKINRFNSIDVENLEALVCIYIERSDLSILNSQTC